MPSPPQTQEKSGSSPNLMQSLQVASQAWANFDWAGKCSSLEKASMTSRDQKEQSLAARKHLSETTKQFKRSVKSMEQSATSLKTVGGSPDNVQVAVKSMEGLAKECRSTIKAYQEEIDKLTRRCKANETSIQTLYQSMQGVPDPLAVLQTALECIHTQQTQMTQLFQTMEDVNQEMSSLQAKHEKDMANAAAAVAASSDSAAGSSELAKQEKEELMQLRKEVAEYEVEFRSLKNQDITIRKLEAKIAELQEGAEESLAQQLEKARADLAETEGRRAAEALEREAAMERKVHSLELQLKAERAGREATQTHLLEAQDGAGEREAAWEAQRNILVQDAERLREDLHNVSRDRDELRLRVAALEGRPVSGGVGAPTPPPSGMADMLLERKAYEAEVNELSQTANLLREEIRLKEEAANDEKASLLASLNRLEQDRAKLQDRLTILEAQLAAAPSHSYVESMRRELRILKRLEYNADDLNSPERDPEMTGEEQDFESVLVSKLKRVESELVRERNQRVEISKDCDNLKKQLAEAQQAKVDADKVVAGLEVDLEAALHVSTPKTSKALVNPLDGDQNPPTLQTILDGESPGVAPKSPVLSKSAAEKASDDHSVATIIMAQRDRLRARCDALEAERDSFKRELQAQVQASESLKVDNTKLYEKVRYMQTYNNQTKKPLPNSVDLDLVALEQRYEASVDPFRQFSRSERQRKMKEMSPMERVVFVVAKTVLGSKEMRTFLFFYVCGMHLLVFFNTFHASSGGCDDSNHHDLIAHLPPHQHEHLAALATADGTGK